jgi:hypothetical protein
VTATRRLPPVLYGPAIARPAPLGRRSQIYVSTDGVFVDHCDGLAWTRFMALAPTTPPPPPPDPGGDPPPYTPPTPAYLLDTDFETETLASIFNVGVGSHASISTVNPHHGAKHFRDTLVGSSSPSERAFPTGVRQVVFRDWFYISALPANLQYLFSVIGGGHNYSIRVASSGQISMRIDSTPTGLGSVISAGAWHVVDGVIDTTGATATYTARLDGGTAGNMSVVTATADLTDFHYDLSGSNTMTIDHDQLRIHNTASMYPLVDA